MGWGATACWPRRRLGRSPGLPPSYNIVKDVADLRVKRLCIAIVSFHHCEQRKRTRQVVALQTCSRLVLARASGREPVDGAPPRGNKNCLQHLSSSYYPLRLGLRQAALLHLSIYLSRRRPLRSCRLAGTLRYACWTAELGAHAFFADRCLPCTMYHAPCLHFCLAVVPLCVLTPRPRRRGATRCRLAACPLLSPPLNDSSSIGDG